MRCSSVLAALLLALGSARSVHAHPGPSVELRRLGAEIAAAPDDATLWLRRAELRRRQGHPRDALADVRVARRLAPDSTAVQLQYALCLSALGRRRPAERALSELLAVAPTLMPALVERARLRQADGRLDAARADLDAAIALGATPDLVLERGRLDQRRGRLDDEAAGYEQGLTALGSAVVIELMLVDVERRRDAPERALARLDTLLASDPHRADWILLRAEILDQLGQAPAATVERLRALTEADAALHRRPTTLHRVTLARAFFALGDRDAARRALDPALLDAPTLPAVQDLHARLTAAEVP